MDIESKIGIIKSFAEEIVTEEELRSLLETNSKPVAYDGFEPSGIAPMHFGLTRAKNLKKMLDMGIRFKLYLADYFAFLNNKLGGDMESIKDAGRYFMEVWKASGIDESRIEIVWASDLMDNVGYWDRVMRIGKATTLDRVKRAITIMGRKEGDSISAGMLMYPLMQAADIFEMDIDICQLGIDQRRANMLAREASEKYKWKKPVAVHHKLVLGLMGIPSNASGSKEAMIDYKMSKSNPSTAIYVHDTHEEIKKKINSAYCPERTIEGNPIFNYLETTILDSKADQITIERPSRFGGSVEFENYGELVEGYKDGKIHPADLKNFASEKLEEMIKPIREHFIKDRNAARLYERMKSYRITR